MPLSELLRLATGKLESRQQKPCSTLVSSRGEDDLVELVWENGQIMMQSQSSKAARSLAVGNSTSNTNKTPDSEVGHAATAKIGKFGGVQSVLDDMALLVGSGELALCQDGNMAPLLRSCPSKGYGPDALCEMSGVSANNLSSFVSVDKRSENGLKAHVLCSWPSQHCQTSDALGCEVSDIIRSNDVSSHLSAMFGNTDQGRYIMNDSSTMKMEMQENAMVPNNSMVLNFSHFKKALVSAQLSASDGIRTSVSSDVDRVDIVGEGSPACAGTPFKAILIDQSNNMSKDSDFHDSCVKLSMINSRQVVDAPEEACPPERTEKMCRKLSMETNTGNSIKGLPDDQRTIEPAVASSSACSGNGADRVSCEQTHNSKRNFFDTQDSECRSTDDIEAESTGLKKQIPARGGTASKRSRAAEVHNLSERRRRDRINKKMRTLQELIPNCNKVDKASMLEEAIEYLKTLQFQVQIMSMGGAGLCMPSMMIPTGMQHMLHAHGPRISPVGLGMGMGMGMGYGMGMLGMTGGAPGYPIFPMSSMQALHFPFSMSGPNNFQIIPAPNLYGHLNQGLPNLAQSAPLAPTGQPPVMPSMGLSFLANIGHNEVTNAALTLSSGDHTSNKNSQPISIGEPGSSVSHKSNQLQTTNENKGLDQFAAEQERNKYGADAVGHTTLTSSTATGISKESGHD